MPEARGGHAPRVVIIGAGLAGISAALTALESGAAVLMLDRGGLGLGTNSALANGVFAGPTRVYAPEQYLVDTLAVGKDLNRRELLEVAAARACEALAFLAPHGLDLAEGPAAYSYRSPRPDVFRGAEMMRALAAALRGRPGFSFRGGFQVRNLVVEDGRLAGLEGWDRAGRLVLIPAATVILATGGAAAIYARNDNQKSTLGQGWLLAARAGLALMDLEFVQFYPLVMDQPGLPQVMLYPPYPKAAKLVDAQGHDVAAAHGLKDLDQAISLLRDAFAALVYRASQAGPVYMDYTAVPESAWADYPMALFTHLRHDFRRTPVRVMPGAHFCMGGARIDPAARTDLPGLLACGEAAWGLHGANRRGGNALTECAVFGRVAGQTAAAMAAEAGPAGPEREIAPAPAP
ncbi:MAG: FAD-dependent oxidoreductase, partial [Pseudomonadota bacterium]